LLPTHLPSVVLAVTAIVCSPACAGTIRGTVRTPALAGSVQATGAGYPGRAGTMPGMHETVRGLATDAVVYVARLPTGVDSGLAASQSRPTLAQQGQAFVPRVLPVAVGSAVDFPNLDPIYHNVFSLSPVKRFDLGKYPRGHSKTVVFDRTGLVNVYCDIHSDMEAFVLVLPNHAFTQPDNDGAYTLPDLPAGRYELRAWHPDLREITRIVDVAAAGTTVVDLSF
jgi:plastocyanin